MTRNELPTYTGEARAEKRHPDAPADEAYKAAPELVKAVQLALHLRRPLLLEGEPGCGKTRLAYSVADELGIPIEPWPVSSGSKASDGLYRYDAVLRLHDVQLSKVNPKALEKSGRDPSNPRDYVTLGAIGKAFERTDTPSVVLIDEIDKADVDFANDLLTLLDRGTEGFKIREAGNEWVRPAAGFEPIFIITSNREKGNLPDPFLRRCVYHFVRFPSAEDLQEIVRRHYAKDGQTSPEQTSAAIARFMPLRNDLQKPPGTSELLDWLNVLDTFEKPRGKGFAALNAGLLPFPQVLVKIAADLQKVAGLQTA